MFDYFTFGAGLKADDGIGEQSNLYEILSPDEDVPSSARRKLSRHEHFSDIHQNHAFNDGQLNQWSLPSPPSSEDFDFADRLDRCLYVTRPGPTSPPSSNRNCRRLGRQKSSQLLYTATHIKKIEAMLEDFISTGEQSNVLQYRETPTPSTNKTKQEEVHNDENAEHVTIHDTMPDEGYHGIECREETLQTTAYSLSNVHCPLGIRDSGQSYALYSGENPDYTSTPHGQPRVHKQIRQRRRRRHITGILM